MNKKPETQSSNPNMGHTTWRSHVERLILISLPSRYSFTRFSALMASACLKLRVGYFLRCSASARRTVAMPRVVSRGVNLIGAPRLLFLGAGEGARASRRSRSFAATAAPRSCHLAHHRMIGKLAELRLHRAQARIVLQPDDGGLLALAGFFRALAAAAFTGLARTAPNGSARQRDDVTGDRRRLVFEQRPARDLVGMIDDVFE